jgi:transposase-like protein
MNEPSESSTTTTTTPVRKLKIVSVGQKAEWVTKYLESGLSLREFSDQHGLGYMSLYRWVRKQRGLSKPPPKRSDGAIDFTELKLPVRAQRSDWAVELTLPNGTVLRLAKDTPPTLVEQLLRVC